MGTRQAGSKHAGACSLPKRAPVDAVATLVDSGEHTDNRLSTHCAQALPDIVAVALDAVEKLAAASEAIQHLVAEGNVCRIGIKDGLFVYCLTHAGPTEGASEGMSN
jgi:hypothetical protein